MKTSLIIYLCAFSIALSAQVKKTVGLPNEEKEGPIPCILRADELPAFWGVKLGMPVGDAKKLFKKPVPFGGKLFPGRSYQVFKASLKGEDIGMPVDRFDFVAKINDRIDSVGIQFSISQKGSQKEIFEKAAGIIKIPQEYWYLKEDHGNSYKSWDVECVDFMASFVAQKNAFYRLSIFKYYEIPGFERKP